MRCLICGAPDAACGAAPLEKPVFGEIAPIDVAKPDTPIEADVERKPVADVQVDD